MRSLLTVASLILPTVEGAAQCGKQEVRKQMSTAGPVDQAQALAIATKVIHDSKPSAEFVVQNEKTMERDFGWVYFYLPKRYMETHDMGALTPGSGPLVVLRQNGSTAFLSTSVPPNVAIQTFERQWQSKMGRAPQN